MGWRSVTPYHAAAAAASASGAGAAATRLSYRSFAPPFAARERAIAEKMSNYRQVAVADSATDRSIIPKLIMAGN